MNNTSPSLVDSSQLAAISAGVEAMMVSIIDDFGEKALTDLRNALERNGGADPKAMQELFHQMKGAGGTLGMGVLQEECRLLEERGRDGSAVSEEALRKVVSLVEASCLEAKSYL